MKAKVLFVALAGLSAGLLCGCGDDENQYSKESERYDIALSTKSVEVNEQTQQFSFNFLRTYNGLSADQENYCISPLSAGLCLGMLLNGADGNTYTEIQKALGYEAFSNAEINEYAKALQTELPKMDSNVTFTDANSIWLNQFEVLTSFVDVNRDNYGAEVQSLPFNQAAVDQINNWCSEKTNGKIPTIIDGISANERVCLINAIYFNGPWKYRFDTSDTEDRSFYKADGTEIQVPTMNRNQTNIKLYVDEEVTLVDLPYGNEAFSMVLFMPADPDKTTMDQLINDLDAAKWSHWMDAEESHCMNLFVPSFEMAPQSMNLIKMLQSLGINDAFQKLIADFSKMSEQSLYIDRLLQKTYIKVNEEGTEAAAVTNAWSAGLSENAHTVDPDAIHFDHPFGFVVKEQSTGAILFAGKCGNPEK